MKDSLFARGLLCFLFLGSTAALAQSSSQVDRLNSYWDNLDKNYPNLKKEYKTAPIQTPGKFQTAGDIKIPRGEKAISRKSEPCNQRFTVGADTLFEFDKATLNRYALETLNVLKPMIVRLGTHPIRVEGHTDGKGSDEYNQGLSERRAERVKNWLLENHICTASAVSIEGFGKKHPVAPNANPDGSDNPQGRALNRRVEITVDTCKTVEEASSISTSANTASAASGNSASSSSGTPASGGAEPAASQSPGTSDAIDNNFWLPYNNVVSADEIKSSYTRLNVTPLQRNDLYFEILLPNNWDSIPIEVPQEAIKDDAHHQVPLGQFEPKEKGSNAIVEVRYMRVPEEVSLTRFVKKYAEASGFEIVTRQQGTFNERPVEDCLLKKKTENFGMELTRITASRKGPLVMFVAGSCPEKEYEKWKKTFAVSAVTFDPVGKK